MTLLLDTHAVLWASLSPELLSRTAARAISDAQNTILVSAVSALEISTKVRLGKLPQAEELEHNFLGDMKAAGYALLPIYAEDTLRAGRLIGTHRDPFDRIIAAQALAGDYVVLSADAKLDTFGVRRVW